MFNHYKRIIYKDFIPRINSWAFATHSLKQQKDSATQAG